MIQFNFLLFGAESAIMREMLGELLHTRPKDIVGPTATHQFSYKDVLPLTINFILCATLEEVKTYLPPADPIHDVLFVFDVSNAKSFDALAPQIISGVSKDVSTNRPILVGYNASGIGANRIPKDKILLYAQTNDFFYYFEVVPKSKFDFRALFKRLIMENVAEFRQQFPEKYQEEIKQARRAKMEAEKLAQEQAAEDKQKE
jgi:hypothetical protein